MPDLADLKRRVEELETALRPFAEVASWLKQDLPDTFDAGKVVTFPLGDIRKAAALLAGEPHA